MQKQMHMEKCLSSIPDVDFTALMLLNRQSVRYDGSKGIFIYEEQPVNGKNHFTGKHKTYNIKGDLDLSVDPRYLYQDMESRRAFLRALTSLVRAAR